MHFNINVSELYFIKSATGTTIVMVCLSSTNHTAKFKKNVSSHLFEITSSVALSFLKTISCWYQRS